MISDQAIAGSVHAMKMLIMAGADHTVVGVDNLTPLHYAASAGHTEIVQVS